MFNKKENKVDHLSTNEWFWVEKNKRLFLQANILLDKQFKHGFFTKTEENHGPEILSLCLNKTSSIHLLQQVHSSTIIKASESTNLKRLSGDVLISDNSNQSLWVYSADCIPILIADKSTLKVGSCHAGWKGLANNIIYKLINKFIELGSKKEDIIIALGPSISQRYYEFELNLAIKATSILYPDIDYSTTRKTHIIEKLINDKIINFSEEKGVVLLDIRNFATKQIQKSGLNLDQVSVCPLCTYKESKLFNSWRRQGERLVQWNCIFSP